MIIMQNETMIGIVGGVGPYAGVDLMEKILDQTEARSDQEHLSIALISLPGRIEERTAFLLGETDNNPAEVVFEIVVKLEQIGAGIVGIPCNTMHSPRIFDLLLKKMKDTKSNVKLIHMINEVAEFIQTNHPKIKNLGLLCTTGTYKTRVYSDCLEPRGFNVIVPDEASQENLVQNAVFDRTYGIKAQSNPVTKDAKAKLLQAIHYLEQQGAEAIILGCTEIPLAITDKKIGSAIIIDPTLILARALIRRLNPDKLKPLEK